METLVLAIMIGVIALIIICYGTYHNKRIRAYEIRKIKESYGKACTRTYGDGEYEHIRGYYNTHCADGLYHVDDITWNDLNMDAVYRSMNYTQSSAGDEYLYHMLRTPRVTSDLSGIGNAEQDTAVDKALIYDDHMEKLISGYMSDSEGRVKLSIALHDMGRTGKYSIYDYINNLDSVDDSSLKGDYALLITYIVAVILMVFNTTVGGLVLIIALFYGGISYFARKRRIEPYIISFSYVMRLLKGIQVISRLSDEAIAVETYKLKTLAKKMSGFGRFSGLVMSASYGSGNPAELILDYIKIFTHIDIIKFYSMRKELEKHSADIDRMLTLIGYIDACVAIGSYRTYLGKWCVPQIVSKGREASEATVSGRDDNETGAYIGVKAVALYHPLLTDPVPNDVELKRGMLLTGSNASGKSTMLRTITLAAILAESIGTVPAEEYSAPAFRVYTSLALTDDILTGESYYMSEIRSLKRIIDAGKDSETPILAAIDEVLRGTNTVERISASTVIMKQLSGVYGIILAATHDLELTELLKDYYDNYHFEETIEDDDISFAYKLLTGKATTRNAIKLLKISGYDEDLVNAAEAMAERYSISGEYI